MYKQKEKTSWNIIGLMSGTSLDGLDIALCTFTHKNGKWTFEIKQAQTISYSKEVYNLLATAHLQTAEKLLEIHSFYGEYIGKKIKQFIRKNNCQVDFISSHGHTVFHAPSKRYTFQLGHGAAIYAASGLPVICDFRVQDVLLGGQGAPLVPIGDELLFPMYGACLNIGGFANISYRKSGKRMAFDICPANILYNFFSGQLGCTYDKNGALGRKGKVNQSLLDALHTLPYYNENKPKSLSREDIQNTYFPLIAKHKIQTEDILSTLYEHTAIQIGKVAPGKKMLLSGGGAHNKYLIERIRAQCKAEMVIPDKRLIDYKEALIFAFLGVLKMRGETNVLHTVTGSQKSHCSGVTYGF